MGSFNAKNTDSTFFKRSLMREDFFSFELRATTRSKSELGGKDDFYNRLCEETRLKANPEWLFSGLSKRSVQGRELSRKWFFLTHDLLMGRMRDIWSRIR